ncbi:hypothetical protein HG536_0B06220 [Torulaspora globosa]|uniref:Uncharacterized protein n=1 Tax=Torulaspora globosa TaxID=48254 RepID=A0A7G3ZE20_9SACH|nr:uncharacterized protein HG536_0B06220 [Torulaspora globosa]QLL31756.1 hypothetical protein HG536_0B06220 [Torulaspora globosa]
MANDVRNHDIQRQQQQQQQQQQQPLYMSPQTENLTHMYSLVDKLIKQLQKNREEKERVLWSVDILSKQLGKRAGSGRGNNDIVLFNRFLSQRISSGLPASDDGLEGAEKEEILRRQNEQLRKILKAKKDLNRETLGLLRAHEDSLEQIVALLRTNVVTYHKKFIAKVRQKLEDEVFPLEDAEFSSYVDNVNEIHELMLVSEVYRNILRLADTI